MHISIDETTATLGEDCKKVYLEAHPEMVMIPISWKKITFEAFKFYLKGTKHEPIITEIMVTKQRGRK